MAKKKPKWKGPPPRQAFLLPTYFQLEHVNIRDLRRWQAEQQKLVDLHWQWHGELARQRHNVSDKLKQALGEICTHYQFTGWRRTVRYKWSLSPLSAKGSLTTPGGRFNIGDIDESFFPKFPALYLAENIETSFCEMLGQEKNEGLDRFELALTEEKSLTIISVYGELDSVVDLTKPESLKPFVDLIKNFYTSDVVKLMANQIKRQVNVVKTVNDLLRTVLEPNWRAYPMHVDIPANSQIFGQLVNGAGIEGILFPSKHTDKKCLAIFPANLKGGDSFVEIMDEVPKGVELKRLDSKTWDKLV